MSRRLPALTPREVERVVLRLGFVFERARGSHRMYLHPLSKRMVVIPWHRRDLKRGTLVRIIEGAGVTPEEFLAKR